MSSDVLKSETNLEEASFPSGPSQAMIRSIRNTCFRLSLHEAEREMGGSPKNSNREGGRFQVLLGRGLHELAAASHSWSESENKDDPKLTNRTRDKTIQKKGKTPQLFRARRRALQRCPREVIYAYQMGGAWMIYT